MNTNTKRAYLKEIEFQKNMLDNLQRYFKSCLIISPCTLCLIYFGLSYHPMLRIIGIVGLVICIILMVVIGLAIKNGRKNLLKVIDKMETIKK